MKQTILKLVAVSVAAACLAGCATVAEDDIPRTRTGRPDFTGFYDIATLTPLQRPSEYGKTLYMTPEDAAAVAAEKAALVEADAQNADPDRSAPPQGGDGSIGAAGNVGGYNVGWVDNGDTAALIDGKFRTSIIHEPDNGRLPEMTPAGLKRAMARRSMFRENTGEAWWLDLEGPGPYDGPEARTLSDRCLLGFGSTGGPPMLPVLYNNVKRIVQTPQYLMILNEMVHDARVIPIVEDPSMIEPVSDDLRFWLGSSVGYWDGDTLVVETGNFNDHPALWNATRDLRVTERFSFADADTIRYNFTVQDANVWTEPWSGEYPFPRTDTVVYEYACHEGNYAMGNILRGARLLEQDKYRQQGVQPPAGVWPDRPSAVKPTGSQ